jgi:hypothetical protein
MKRPRHLVQRRGWSLAALLAITAVVATSCTRPELTKTASDGQYQLAVTVSRLTYRTADPIDVSAALTYTGPEERVDVQGVDAGLVIFSFKQIDGSLGIEPASRLMCGAEVSLDKGSSTTFKPTKSALWDASQPTASFYLSWVADPQVHLPPGQWSVVSHLAICPLAAPSDAADHALSTAPLVLTVTP